MSTPDRTRRRVVGALVSLPLLTGRAAAALQQRRTREIDISGYDSALLPREHGQLTRLSGTLRRRYPSREHCMQMAAFFSEHRGLLVIVKDARGGICDWEIRPGSRLTIQFYGDVPEVETVPIPPTLEAAAAGYRQWAARQSWVTGRRRASWPLNFFSVASQSSQTAEQAHLQRVLESTAAPIGVWFTQWRRYPFDHMYPDYAAREPQQFARTLGLLRSRGALALPYVNGLLWDQALADFQAGAQVALRTQAHDTVPYNAALNNLRYACPHSPLWQDRIAQARASLSDADGKPSDGIYLDMLAAAEPAMCWSADHGHEPGDPSAWQRGIRALLQRIDGAIMVEGNAEVYLDCVDYLLMHLYTDQADAVPLWQLVYGDQAYPVGWRLPAAVTAAQLRTTLERARRFGVGAGATPWMTAEPERALFDRGVAQAALADARTLQ
jgi:hypothetical protein